MKKRGQFYLIAGIIIVGVIISLIAISNYAKKSQTIIVEDLAKQLKIELQHVLDYDISHSGNTIEDEFGIDYSSHLGSDIELYFIVGDNPIKAYKYVNGDKTEVTSYLTIDENNDKIIFTLDEIDYEFVLVEGENFYFLISQEIKDQRFVATG